MLQLREARDAWHRASASSGAGIAPAAAHPYRPERGSHVPADPYIMDDPALEPFVPAAAMTGLPFFLPRRRRSDVIENEAAVIHLRLDVEAGRTPTTLCGSRPSVLRLP